jgi:predicted glycoside hydrolase/deacetylase ChbG (UPF0249 family)
VSLLEKLGYSEHSKLLMIHADDAGLCHSENLATMQALLSGSVNSFSIMPVCSGFDEIAKFARENPKLDYGIHLTLTCEWKNYKWGPLLSIQEVPSLVNEQGFFYSNRTDLKRNVIPKEVQKELEAQIEKVFDSGLDPTHMDSHMYSIGVNNELLSIYKQLGAKYKLPVQLNKHLIEFSGSNPDLVLDKNDFCVNEIILGNYQAFEQNKLYHFYETTFDTLQPGLTIILIHPAFDTKEMRSITIDHPNFGSTWRQIDFDFFTSQTCKSKIAENDIKLITWRDIKQAMYPQEQ